MYRLNLKFSIFIFFIITACKAQEKKTVYLIFKENEQVNCIKFNSDERQDRSTSTYTGVMAKKEFSSKQIVFFICKEKFSLTEKNLSPEKISIKDFNTLEIVKFDYLISEYIESDMFNKRDVFEKIYFIEKINEKEYLKYEVYWEHAVDRGIQN